MPLTAEQIALANNQEVQENKANMAKINHFYNYVHKGSAISSSLFNINGSITNLFLNQIKLISPYLALIPILGFYLGPIFTVLFDGVKVPYYLYQFYKNKKIGWAIKSAFIREIIFGAMGTSIGALAVIGVFLAILTPITIPVFLIANSLKNLGRSIWKLGEAIYQRFSKGSYGLPISTKIKKLESSLKKQTGKKLNEAELNELTYLINLRRAHRKAIAVEVYSVVKNIVSTVGSVLLLTPFALIGFGMVAASNTLDILDTYNKNPFIRLMNNINTLSKGFRGKPLFDPFGEKTTQDVEMELRKAVDKEIKKAANIKKAPAISGSTVFLNQGMEQSSINRSVTPSASTITPAPTTNSNSTTNNNADEKSKISVANNQASLNARRLAPTGSYDWLISAPRDETVIPSPYQ